MAIPSDPLFGAQWHLVNSDPDELDLSVAEVWADFSGAGVTVAVIDTAFDTTHVDLSANYRTDMDHDFIDDDADASPVDPAENQGTSIMGLIGASADDGGAVGVAYGVDLVGYRVGLSYLNIDLAIGRVVSDNLDIANMAHGRGADIYAADDAAVDAAMDAIAHGRVVDGKALGAILVKSSGVNRASFGDAGREEATVEAMDSTRATITVGAVQQTGDVADFATPGANLLVSAFGAGGVLTTDRTGADGFAAGDHTDSFAGTSAAGAMVSGVAALMLEANPGLGWRDVQQILAYSARHVGSDVGDAPTGAEEASVGGASWLWNGAQDWNGGGLHFSNDYGFGLVDARAAVRLAESWDQQSTSANETEVIISVKDQSFTLPDGDLGGVSYDAANNLAIEADYVALEVDFASTFLADLRIFLTSPLGTTVQLVAQTGGSEDFDGRWRFGANAFRGEDALGTWTVTMVDDQVDDAITVRDVDLFIYGDGVNQEDDLFVFTDEFSDYAGVDGHEAIINAGAGIDTLNAAAVSAVTTLDLIANAGEIDGVAVGLANFNRIYTGDGDDYVLGDGVSNFYSMGRGDDQVVGGGLAERIYGGAGDDDLIGHGGDDRAEGGDGDDRIEGGVGNDILHGGAGHDHIFGGDDLFDSFSDTDQIFGGDGDDHLEAGAGGDELFGGEGDDEIYGGDDFSPVGLLFVDRLFGDGGDDLLYGGNLQESLFGGAGEDRLFGGDIRDFLFGGAEDDALYGDGGDDQLQGDDGADWLDGGVGNDFVFGGLGDDTLIAGMGFDFLDGGEGLDTLDFSSFNKRATVDLLQGTASSKNGAHSVSNIENLIGSKLGDKFSASAEDNDVQGLAGRDWIRAKGGDDRVHAGSGDDFVSGGAGADTLIGHAGDDMLDGKGGADMLFGGNGEDALFGGYASDTLYGGDAQDALYGDARADSLFGGLGGDTLFGGRGGDVLSGGEGRDFIYGGDGDDVLIAGAGFDELTGGAGADIFVFGPADQNDLIQDFEDGSDLIDLTAAGLEFGDLLIVSTGFGANIRVEFSDTRIRMQDFTLAEIDESDFLL